MGKVTMLVGVESWKAYLTANEALFTAPAFEKLSLLEAPETATDAQRSYVEPEPADLEPQDADPYTRIIAATLCRCARILLDIMSEYSAAPSRV